MSELLIDKSSGVLTITLNRLDKKNSLTRTMYAGMAQALAQADADATLSAAVIQGHETVFSAGNDIGEFLNRLSSAISVFSKPLLAAVCGPAVGIGTTMLFHCDLVYAGDNAAFSMPFVNLGLCPEAASSYLAPQLMGYGRAAEALLLGEPFLAETALEMGLVSRIVPPSEASALAQRQAHKLAAKPLGSLIETKRLLKKSQSGIVAERLLEEGASFARLLTQPAAREAFTAFLEKRKPDFSKV
jgi:enoyl-CoA hydratase/carnithine racemase